jgi:hypothetical protein
MRPVRVRRTRCWSMVETDVVIGRDTAPPPWHRQGTRRALTLGTVAELAGAMTPPAPP